MRPQSFAGCGRKDKRERKDEASPVAPVERPESVEPYLVVPGDLHHHREAVVIGGRVAEDVHDGPHLLDLVQTGDWGAHHLPGGAE